MTKKLVFILTLIALVLSAATVDAKNIFKIGRDVNIAEGQRVDSVITIGGQITVGDWLKSMLLPWAAPSWSPVTPLCGAT